MPRKISEAGERLKGQRLRVLDLGCANGHIGRTLRSDGYKWRFFGIDFNEAMVTECRRSEIYESALTADLNNEVPVLENGYFDVVICAGVSEFVESGPRLVNEIARVLCQSGIAILTFEMTTPDSLPRGVVQPNGIVKFHYTEPEVRELMAMAGLKVDAYEQVDAYFSPTLCKWIPYHFIVARPTWPTSLRPVKAMGGVK
ncbi:MAG: class I SAM-dependent methyltransferase [Calothrix sp. SM1_5_4]|nr:class I SAM-dependent methyltransferase [Calothrix sp. SM1_5_4]